MQLCLRKRLEVASKAGLSFLLKERNSLSLIRASTLHCRLDIFLKSRVRVVRRLKRVGKSIDREDESTRVECRRLDRLCNRLRNAAKLLDKKYSQ